MKKIFVIFLALSILGCNNKIEKNNIEDKQVEKEDTNIKYVDNNPVKLGIYNGNRELINNYSDNFFAKKDIVWLSIFPTDEEKLSDIESKKIWEANWNMNIDKGYKFGIEIIYTLFNGEHIDITILKPSDNKYFEYVEIYLYDGYNATTKWFDHLDDNELNENTVFTSIKITGGELINEVNSEISLRVFSYDTSDDFDSNGKYIGNSFAQVLIKEI